MHVVHMMKPVDQALLITVQSLQPTDFEGYMTKCGGSIHSWKKRWFVLKGNQLFYFKNNTALRAKGVIVMSHESLIREEEKHKKNCISISTLNRVFFMYSETTQEHQNWLNKLISVLEVIKSTPMPMGTGGNLNGGVQMQNGMGMGQPQMGGQMQQNNGMGQMQQNNGMGQPQMGGQMGQTQQNNGMGQMQQNNGMGQPQTGGQMGQTQQNNGMGQPQTGGQQTNMGLQQNNGMGQQTGGQQTNMGQPQTGVQTQQNNGMGQPQTGGQQTNMGGPKMTFFGTPYPETTQEFDEICKRYINQLNSMPPLDRVPLNNEYQDVCQYFTSRQSVSPISGPPGPQQPLPQPRTQEEFTALINEYNRQISEYGAKGDSVNMNRVATEMGTVSMNFQKFMTSKTY